MRLSAPVRVGRFPFLLAAALVTGGCGSGGGPSGPTPSTRTASDFVTSVTAADGTAAALQSGAPPAPSGGPVAQATGESGVPPGGSATLRVTATSAFDTIDISIAGVPNGFWQLKLAAPTTDVTIAYAVSSTAPVAATTTGLTSAYASNSTASALQNTALSLGIQVVSPSGSVGAPVSQTLTNLPAATEAWSVGLGTVGHGLDVSACGVSVNGGFTSQVFHAASGGGAFHDVWSPRTPVVEVNGSMSATALSATFRCVGTGATGSMSATGSGSQLTGTATLSGRTISICVARGFNAC